MIYKWNIMKGIMIIIIRTTNRALKAIDLLVYDNESFDSYFWIKEHPEEYKLIQFSYNK